MSLAWLLLPSFSKANPLPQPTNFAFKRITHRGRGSDTQQGQQVQQGTRHLFSSKLFNETSTGRKERRTRHSCRARGTMRGERASASPINTYLNTLVLLQVVRVSRVELYLQYLPGQISDTPEAPHLTSFIHKYYINKQINHTNNPA